MIGWLSTLFLSLCGLPQAWKAYKEGHADGLSNGFLFLWTSGEICLVIHTFLVRDWPVFWNAVANLAIMGFILRYKFWRVCHHQETTLLAYEGIGGDNPVEVRGCQTSWCRKVVRVNLERGEC